MFSALTELDAEQINMWAELRCEPNEMSTMVSAVKERHKSAVRRRREGSPEKVKLDLPPEDWVTGKKASAAGVQRSGWRGHSGCLEHNQKLCPVTENQSH